MSLGVRQNEAGESLVSRAEFNYDVKEQSINQMVMPKRSSGNVELFRYDLSKELISSDQPASTSLDRLILSTMESLDIERFNLKFQNDFGSYQSLKANVDSPFFSFRAETETKADFKAALESMKFEFKSPIIDDYFNAKVKIVRDGKDTMLMPSLGVLDNIEIGIGTNSFGDRKVEEITTLLAPGVLWRTERVSQIEEVTPSFGNSLLRNRFSFSEDNLLGIPPSEISLTSDPKLGTIAEGRLFKEFDQGSISLSGLYKQSPDASSKNFGGVLNSSWSGKHGAINSLEMELNYNPDAKLSNGLFDLRFQFDRRW